MPEAEFELILVLIGPAQKHSILSSGKIAKLNHVSVYVKEVEKEKLNGAQANLGVAATPFAAFLSLVI